MANDRWIYGVWAVSIFALLYGALIVRGRFARRRTLRGRQGATIVDFVQEFDEAAYSKTVLEMAYQDLADLAQMPIRRADDLEKTLGLLQEDFTDKLEKRCKGLGVDDVWKSPHASLFPLKTAEDYVRFLSAVISEQEKSLQQK